MANADQLIELFHEAKARPAGAARERFLADACGEDAALRKQIVSLLEADADEGESEFLKNPQALPPVTLLTEKLGDKISHYKLLQQIGEGGCGVVYMAEQEEPVRRRVALKVIKLGMDTKQVIARFEAERQALALMDHANIAKVFDAGATDTGRPYFVMELVRGMKITEFCDEHKLSTEERLKLFIQVCGAIQHAHQKGVIHRDIKPSNILVTINDPGSPGVPKVIDFGIAKATAGRLTDQTLFTAFAQFIGTPAYMSPEQAVMTSLDVDTRSDIYSLGVLLYELLTGGTPFDQQELLAAGLDGMRHTIREMQPPRPSTRLSAMAAEVLTMTAQHRLTEPPKLLHLVRGDLDWIVMKCLEKDRARRYETANGLVMDIERHLNCEPVVARPPSRLYEFQKSVRRHKFGFAAAAALIIVLGLGVLASTLQAVRATRAEREQSRSRAQAEANEKKAALEAAKSQQVAQFMKDMLKGVGPARALGRDTTMLREILDQTASRLNELKGQPAVEADLRTTLGDVYYDLGEFTNAVAMHREALALRKELLGDEHPEVANSLSGLARVYYGQGRFTEAETIHREALAMRRKLLGDDHRDVSESLDNVARMLAAQRHLAEAEAVWREALAMRRKLLGGESAGVAYILHPLAWIVNDQARPSEAEALSREELAIWRKLFGNEHPNVGWALGDLTIFLREQGKLTEAETTVREALAIGGKQSGDNPTAAATFLRQLAWVLHGQGKGEEAERVFRAELVMRRKLLGNDHPEVAATLHNLAINLRDQGKSSEAESAIREALAIRRKRLGQDHPEVANAFNLLSELLKAQGKAMELDSLLSLLRAQPGAETSAAESAQSQFGHLLWQIGDAYLQRAQFTEAEGIYDQALQKFKQMQVQFPTNGFYRQEQAFSHRLLSDVMQRTTRLAEAEASLRTAWEIYMQLAKAIPSSTFYLQEAAFTRGRIAEVLLAQGKLNEAEAMCRDELRRQKELFGAVHRTVDVALVSLARVLEQEGRLAEAEAAWREELALERKLSGDEHPFVANSLVSLARVLNHRHQPAEAEAAFREALAIRRKLLGDEHKDVAGTVMWLAKVLEDQGKLTEAEAGYRDHLTIQRKVSGNDHPAVATALAALTRTLLVQQEFSQAEPLARECLSIREKEAPDDWLTFNARNQLGGSLLGQKKYAEAEPLLLSAYEGMKQREDKIPAIGKPRVKESLQRLVQLYEGTGRPEKAADWSKKLAEFDQAEAERKTAAAKQ